MKKAIVVIVVLLAIAGGAFYWYSTRPPKSAQIREEMGKVLNDRSESDMMKVFKFRMLKSDLVSAYVHEEKYDLAINMIEDEIRSDRQEHKLFNSASSASYGIEAANFDRLAAIYEMKGDKELAGKAKAQAEKARQKEMSLAKKEPKQKSILDE